MHDNFDYKMEEASMQTISVNAWRDITQKPDWNITNAEDVCT